MYLLSRLDFSSVPFLLYTLATAMCVSKRTVFAQPPTQLYVPTIEYLEHLLNLLSIKVLDVDSQSLCFPLSSNIMGG